MSEPLFLPIRVGWLVDEPTSPGGAELTQAEFRAAAPDRVKIIDCPAGAVDLDCDRYVIHNCVQYTIDDLAPITGKPITKYWHDVGPWIVPEVKDWIARHTRMICCSPVQSEYMGLTDVSHIPPPVDLDRFTQAAEHVNGSRSGAVCIGSWRNYGKAPHKAAEWATRNGGIDFFGGGPLAPPGSVEVTYEAMPGLLAQYETFVFLPTVIEPFGRLVAEAWAAGCGIVTNELVGAGYWIKHDPEAIESAGRDFWDTVLA